MTFVREGHYPPVINAEGVLFSVLRSCGTPSAFVLWNGSTLYMQFGKFLTGVRPFSSNILCDTKAPKMVASFRSSVRWKHNRSCATAVGRGRVDNSACRGAHTWYVDVNALLSPLFDHTSSSTCLHAREGKELQNVGNLSSGAFVEPHRRISPIPNTCSPLLARCRAQTTAITLFGYPPH